MTPEKWQKICAAVDHAMEMTATKRQTFLDRLRAEDTEVASEVEAMLVQPKTENGDKLQELPRHLLDQSVWKEQVLADTAPPEASVSDSPSPCPSYRLTNCWRKWSVAAWVWSIKRGICN